ncbi:CLUMA_CG005690, isoform A [Clunio marinus]|uniref:CLUMA_CG005690, isoform A n=1 Tax=Clunio marinus TaxID=568069 RepID=A0A1J1I150_9DIPT|nr:CLUMA_CG005690, isoform A [Clunio marinus]
MLKARISFLNLILQLKTKTDQFPPDIEYSDQTSSVNIRYWVHSKRYSRYYCPIREVLENK